MLRQSSAADPTFASLFGLVSEVTLTMAQHDEPVETRLGRLERMLSHRLGIALEIELVESGQTPAAFPSWIAESESRFSITAADTVFGSIRASHSRPLTVEERLVLAETASRIALWLSFFQRHDRDRALAEHLQRALLPQRLPKTPLLTFDAAYRPASSEAIVGGDWYDAFELPDGRIAFSIGDVAGHGLEAAVVMGEVRQAFRAAAIDPDSASAVLERANTIVNLRGDPSIVTAIFGILDPGNLTFAYACAGHPPPVVALDASTSCRLPGGGLPLGVAAEVGTRDWTFTLPPGGLLLLYTDGLLEYDRQILEGEVKLLHAARRATSDTSHPARTLLADIFEHTSNVDDVAVLALQATDHWADDVSLTASAQPLFVPLFRFAMREFGRRHHIPTADVQALELCVGELAGNAVLHAYDDGIGNIRLDVRLDDDTVVLAVEDWGRWRRVPAREHGGRGLKLVRSLTDRVDIETEHRHTRVVARKRIKPAS